MQNDEYTDGSIGRMMEEWDEAGFVGRSFELRFFDEYAARLSEKTERILNVHGTGGMG
ncbi:MAG: LuxR family transcriptional regulator, partial [Paenibacillus sp.]|nr:LuxR family transcriptional regulator [Paenibacillus sp.]